MGDWLKGLCTVYKGYLSFYSAYNFFGPQENQVLLLCWKAGLHSHEVATKHTSTVDRTEGITWPEKWYDVQYWFTMYLHTSVKPWGALGKIDQSFAMTPHYCFALVLL